MNLKFGRIESNSNDYYIVPFDSDESYVLFGLPSDDLFSVIFSMNEKIIRISNVFPDKFIDIIDENEKVIYSVSTKIGNYDIFYEDNKIFSI